MLAILKIIEKLTPEGITLFEEALLFLPQTTMKAGFDEIRSSEKDVIGMLPFGGKISADHLKLAIINHYGKQGFVLSGIEPALLIKDRIELNFYLQVPDDNEYRSIES